MSLHSAAAGVSSKVLLTLVVLCGARTLQAQPYQPIKSDVPLVSLDEVERILNETSRVTLSFKDALPQEIFAEFTRQTGVPVRLREFGANLDALAKPVSVELKDVPFEDAVKELEQQMQVSLDSNNLRGGFEVSPGAPPRNLPTLQRRRPKETESRQSDFNHALGSMHIKSGSYTRSLEFDNFRTDVSETVTMQIYARLDPRLKIGALARNADIEIAVDEMGRSLLLPTKALAEGEQFNTLSNSETPTFYVPLRRDTASRIAHLKGTYRVRIATRSETWEITDLFKTPQVRRMTRLGIDQTLSFLSLQLEGREWHVKLLVQNEGRLRLYLPGGAMSVGTVRLLNAQNRELLESGWRRWRR